MKSTIALLAAIILCPMAAAEEPAPSHAQARVLGGIPDGTPPPPAPPKPPFAINPDHILAASIKREGGRNVLVQRIAPLALPPPPAPAEYPSAISPEAFRAKLAAYRALHPRPLLVGIGATVYRAAGKPTLAAIAEAAPSETGILIEPQSRRNALYAYHFIPDPANHPEGEVAGHYTFSRPLDLDSGYGLNQLADLTPYYLTTRITELSFGSISIPSVIPFVPETTFDWTEAIAGFTSGPVPNGDTLYQGRIQQRKFRLVADRSDHEPISKTFLKVTAKRPYGTYELTEILETEPLTIDLPSGRFATDWIDMEAPMITGQETVVSLIPVEIVVPKSAPNGGFVTGAYVSATELKVAEMQDSLTLMKDLGEVVRADLDVSKDADRFYIRYAGGGVLTHLGNASATLSTRECADSTYNDDPTGMDLTQVGDDLISAPMLLVSDHIDDDYAGDFVNVADDQMNDPTHIVQLGGKVRLDTVTIGSQTYTVNLDLPVRKKRQVTVEFIILDDGNVDIADMTATLERDFKAASERYAQVGVEIVKGSLSVKPMPEGLDLPGGKLIIEKLPFTNRELTDGGHFMAEDAVDMPNPGVYRTNLMYDSMLFDASFFDGKRLIDRQEAVIQRSQHAKPIQP